MDAMWHQFWTADTTIGYRSDDPCAEAGCTRLPSYLETDGDTVRSTRDIFMLIDSIPH